MKKKMLFVCAAGLLTAGIASAEVPSYNIVGYLESKEVTKSYLTGPTFVPVLTCLETDPNHEIIILLEDVKVKGMDPMLDSIQFLSATTGKTLVSATYFDSEWEEYEGWWDFNDALEVSLDKEPIALSQGFLCNFISGNPITITYAGEVLPGEVTIKLSTKSPILANFLPVDLKLGHLKAEGMDPMLDSIQFLSATTGKTLVSATYFDSEWEEFEGWWDFNDALEVWLNDEDLPAGAAVFGNFISGETVSITFPDPTLPLPALPPNPNL